MTESSPAFEQVVVRRATAASGSAAHLSWKAPAQGDRLVQVYVDGELADVTASPQERSLWLIVDHRRAHQIELLAVEADGDVWRPRRERAQRVLRDVRLPVDAQLRVEVDGELDGRLALWPVDVGRGGFGARFGLGPFGIGGDGGPGLGGGELGAGPLGIGGSWCRWRPGALAAGSHELTVTALSPCGEALAPAWAGTWAVDVEVLPAADLGVTSGGELTWENA